MKTKSKAKDIDKDIGGILKQLRVDKGFSQEALAKALNLSVNQIVKYEKGINRIAVSTAIAIMFAMGMSIKELVSVILKAIELTKQDKINN